MKKYKHIEHIANGELWSNLWEQLEYSLGYNTVMTMIGNNQYKCFVMIQTTILSLKYDKKKGTIDI